MHYRNGQQGATHYHGAQSYEQMSRNGGVGQRMRTEDSWIEIPSQSTVPVNPTGRDTIITTGLSVRRDDEQQLHQTMQHIEDHPAMRAASVAGSSQDEYEESESESDRVMSSSNEDIARAADDEDETSTALGINAADRDVFTPQPNAFSHPPASGHHRAASVPTSYFPAVQSIVPSDRLPSNRMTTQRAITQRQQHREHASISQPDHDAALRASLTTLLSCAAAVRPKIHPVAISAVRSTQPTSLRLIPESELNAMPSKPSKSIPKRRSRESSKERQPKKVKGIRTTTSSVEDEVMAPTITTWMISAGVVLVFSAISFSAGYAWGKEAGYLEGNMSCNSCGRDMIKTGGGGGLRKFRWSGAAQSVRA